jgi:hypothetical protein
MTKLSKVPWNLSVRSDIKRAMEVHCALSGQEISEITEQLWRELLKREGTSIVRELAESAPAPVARKPVRYSKGKRKK